MGVRASFGSPAPAVPGETARCELTVENTGDRSEDVRLELGGEPAAWGWITPPTLVLAPGGSGVARVTFKLPKGPHVAVGPLAVTVSVVTAGTPAPLLLQGTLEVAPFTDVHAALHPHTSRGSREGRHVLRVENRGNAHVTALIDSEGDDLSVRAEPDRVEVGPGESVDVEVTARAGRQGFRGGTATRAFAVLVRAEGQASPARVEGSVELAPAGRVGRVALALLVLALAAVGLRAAFPASGGSSGNEPAETGAPPSRSPTDCPARDHLSPDANGIRREGVQPSFDYTFLFVSRTGCEPARFNPCAPVRYALNRRLASDAHVADLMEGLRKLSDATGLQFERVADTDEDPRLVPRLRRQPDGSFGWPPVVIGWSHLGTGEALRGGRDPRRNDEVVGGGGRPEVVSDVIVTGNLVLNLDAVTDTDTRAPVPHGFGTGVNWGRIILHELAHVIGLGHVESRTSIMNEALTQQTISSSEWGIGDLAGLRQLGRESGCLNVPAVPLQGAPR